MMARRAEAGSALSQPRLIGREQDLADLLPPLARAESGSGSTVVLYGEGGVGKTRLAEALVDGARERGFRVVAGRAFPFESGVPYALFADAFMPLIRELDSAAMATLTRGAESELSVVLPGLGLNYAFRALNVFGQAENRDDGGSGSGPFCFVCGSGRERGRRGAVRRARGQDRRQESLLRLGTL